MAIRRFKPTSAGTTTRFGPRLPSNEITCTDRPEKSLLEPQRQNRRSQQPRSDDHPAVVAVVLVTITVIIDFKRAKDGHSRPRSHSIQYDPNRTANIALLVYADGEKRYILAPKGLEVGRLVMSRRQTRSQKLATP